MRHFLKSLMGFGVVFLILVFIAWYPWITEEEALNIVDRKVAQMKKEQPNLCAMAVNKKSIKKVLFGYTEKVSYDCTITDPEYGVWKGENVVFVTFYKGIIGMPNKTVLQNPEN